MAYKLGKLALPGHDVVWTATLSMTNEETDPNYAVEMAQDWNPGTVAKATTSSTALTIALPGNVTPVAVALINTNAETASITNPAGLNQAITIPAVTADGQRVGAWQSLVGLANVTDDEFTVNLSRGSGPVWIGRVVLVVALQDVNWQAGARFGALRPGVTMIPTRLGTILIEDAQIRTRWAEAEFTLEEDAAMWRGLDQSTKGPVLPFLLIPDELVNEAWWVRTLEPFAEEGGPPGLVSITRRFEELAAGPPNG